MHWLRSSLLALTLLGTPALGAEFAVPTQVEQVVEVPAPPSNFETMYAPFVRIHAAPEDSVTQLRLARHAARSLPDLADELDVPIGDTIHVYIAQSEEQFFAMQPGRAPTWADGTAWPSLGIIYLKSNRIRAGTATPLESVLDHELVHILLGRAFAPQTPPRWLQEGVAQVKAGEYGPQTTERLARGMIGGLIELESLTRGFPSDPLRADLAYAQSADLVAWMRVEYGRGALPIIIDELARGEDIRAAVRRATGDSLDEVDRKYRSRLESGPGLSISALVGENTFWGFGAILLLVGGVMKRRQFKQRLVEMEEEERALDALLESIAREQAEGPGREAPSPSAD